MLQNVTRVEIARLFGEDASGPVTFGPFGEFRFPYHRMGAIDSLDLFGLDELILFSFYWANRARYRKTLDIGANIGLHSLVMSRCGFAVTAYEPDPRHVERLRAHLAANGAVNVHVMNAAVSSRKATLEFVRVLGNTTGSHIAGAKPDPYGALDRFPVQAEAFREILMGVDLVKMDVEGHEAEILLSTARDDWRATDAVLEVGSPQNAHAIFDHFQRAGVHMYAQKTGWRLVRDLADMPTSYREGSLFVTCGTTGPWPAASETRRQDAALGPNHDAAGRQAQ